MWFYLYKSCLSHPLMNDCHPQTQWVFVPFLKKHIFLLSRWVQSWLKRRCCFLCVCACMVFFLVCVPLVCACGVSTWFVFLNFRVCASASWLFLSVYVFPILTPLPVSSPAIRAHRGRADGSPASQPFQWVVSEGAGRVSQERGEKATGPQRYGTYAHEYTSVNNHQSSAHMARWTRTQSFLSCCQLQTTLPISEGSLNNKILSRGLKQIGSIINMQATIWAHTLGD